MLIIKQTSEQRKSHSEQTSFHNTKENRPFFSLSYFFLSEEQKKTPHFMYPHVERNRYDPLTSPVVSAKRNPAVFQRVVVDPPPINHFAPVNATWAHAQAPTVAQLQDARRREQDAAEEAFQCPSFAHNRLCPWCGSFCHEDHLVSCEKRLMQ